TLCRFLSTRLPPPRSTLFPYTTLFRSEKIAEIVHANSAVREGPFVALNCGAIPADLVEAELFGAEAGAYTGATRAREGKFEAARSEEHTSELQSRENLVCRLLLEKKK